VRADILLLRPKGSKTDSRVFGMEQLGLAYLAAAARAAGNTVDIVDGFLEPRRYDAVLAGTSTNDYRLIGYPVYPETVRKVGRDVRQLRDNAVETHIVVGSHLATLHDVQLLRDFPQFDSAIRGEGELTLVDLIGQIKAENDYRKVLGLTFRENGRIHRNGPRPNLEDLDRLPFPARDTLPLVLKAGNTALVYSSRGCNARCEFCSVHNFFRASPGGVWRGRSAENVVDEIHYLADQFGVKEVAFADEQFLGHGERGTIRALRIAEELRRRKLAISWYIETRATSIRRNVFARLRDAGLAAVFMGLESGYDPALKQLRKGLRSAQSLEAVQVLKELAIIPVVGFIMFRPDTTLLELRCNLDFLEELACVDLTALVTALRVYSGTETEASLRRRGMLQGTYYDYAWDFCDDRVEQCYMVMLGSADVLSVTYNAFAGFRRLGLLSYSEVMLLQKLMNARPIAIMRRLLDTFECGDPSYDDLHREVRLHLMEASEDFLRLLRLLEIAAPRRDGGGVKLLNPMYLC
jgi:anaerobic magnesium-protoporphyrin IX monomethyl ester cyclase